MEEQGNIKKCLNQTLKQKMHKNKTQCGIQNTNWQFKN